MAMFDTRHRQTFEAALTDRREAATSNVQAVGFAIFVRVASV